MVIVIVYNQALPLTHLLAPVVLSEPEKTAIKVPDGYNLTTMSCDSDCCLLSHFQQQDITCSA